MILATRKFRGLIDAAAARFELPFFQLQPPGYLVEAVCLVESAGDPMARRYEPHQDAPGRSDAAKDPDRPGVDDGDYEDDASWGLMQVMGWHFKALVGVDVTARMNYARWAYNPVFAIEAGCTILKRELEATGGDVPRALARYNGGSTGDRLINGVMRRQPYVDLVLHQLASVIKDRQEHP